MRTKLIFTGGFLGAGKTTLLQQAAAFLTAKGKLVGLITNDQAEDLVDTHFLSSKNEWVKELSGSCFCCNYDGFLGLLNSLMEQGKTLDLIIAEPVGSCTDISATILQPLKQHMTQVVDMAPFTVLADPYKLEEILDGGDAGMHPATAYIYRRQLEEADLILISKTDIIDDHRLRLLKEKLALAHPQQDVLTISATEGTGLEEWIEYLYQNKNSGSRIAQVDYDIYAEGEAALGWLNASVMVEGTGVDWNQFLRAYFIKLNDLLGVETSIGHIKIWLEAVNGNYITGNQTGLASTLQFRGDAGTGNFAGMTINARVEADPERLKEIVFTAMARSIRKDMFYKIRQCRALKPGYPRPQYHYRQVVN